MKINLGDIPEQWFLYELRHIHTPIKSYGEVHRPKHWRVALQRIDGGRLKEAFGITAQEAVNNAIKIIEDYETS